MAVPGLSEQAAVKVGLASVSVEVCGVVVLDYFVVWRGGAGLCHGVWCGCERHVDDIEISIRFFLFSVRPRLGGSLDRPSLLAAKMAKEK